MATVGISLMLMAIVTLTSGQPNKLEWLPEELHNPQLHPNMCGLPPNEPGFICDPNGLTGNHISSINWILKDAAYNSTRCPCSSFYCEHLETPSDMSPRGYHIGVALVKKMKIQTNLGGKRNTLEDQGQLFASTLETAWNLGRCEEDIIIFYSHDDKVLAIYGGRTAKNKLTPYYSNLLSYRVGSRFSEGRIVEAINNLLYDLKFILNCESHNEQDCILLETGRSASSVAMTSVWLVLVAAISLLFS